MEPQYITLDHGSGGGRTAQLIEDLLLPALSNPHLAPLGDGALLDLSGPLAFSTDSFVIAPIFFPASSPAGTLASLPCAAPSTTSPCAERCPAI